MSNWLSKLLGNSDEKASTELLYNMMMERALQPALYETGLAEDSFDGRFEAVTLHSALIMRNLRQHGEEGQHLANDLYKKVFNGFDHALRERGAGDSSIARKIRGLGERFFGLARAIDGALAEDDPEEPLKGVLVKNAIGGGLPAKLAKYLLELDHLLAREPLQSFQSGQCNLPIIPV